MEWKIWLALIIVSLVTIISAFGLTNYLYNTFYVDQQINLLLSHGNALAASYEQNEQLFLEKVQWSGDSLEWDIIYTDDPMLLSGGLPFDMTMGENLITFEERQSLLSGENVVMIRNHEKLGQDILAVVIPLLKEEQLRGAIFLYTPLSTMYEPFRSFQVIILVTSIVLLVLMIFIARKITNYLVKPIKKMTEVTKRMAAGDFSERVMINQKDELGELTHSFNTMAISLQEVEEKRKEFLANVSHELRTPISYMKGFTEGVEEGVVEIEKYITIMKRETSRLERLIHDLLDLAQLEGDSYPMKSTPISFAQLIIDVVERFEIEWKERGIEVILDIDEDIIIYGDFDRLEQVVSNLLQNAIRHSGNDSNIEVSLVENKEKEAVMQIKDEGEGIPEKDLPKVLDRFYRVNKARTRKDGGTGIGLAIVHQIIKKHEGTILIKSKLGIGTTVTVKLPLYEEK